MTMRNGNDDLRGKIILVAGGAAGIGAATAIACAERSAEVIIADQDEETGRQTAEKSGATFLRVNVTEEESVRSLADYIEKAYGRLDVLIQTAGILLGAFTPIEELTLETFNKVMEVNLTGTFLCLKYITPLLKRSRHGVVLLLSSPAANFPSSSYAYGASKGGVAAFGIAAAQKLGEDGIRVNLVAPGGIDTGMKRSVIAVDSKRRGLDYEKAIFDSKLGSPEGVARVMAWLASDEADYVRGLISTR
jgi:NAD(P)-dependent dehydrogenase (short-subunit alcohol dehydrogenase family)